MGGDLGMKIVNFGGLFQPTYMEYFYSISHFFLLIILSSQKKKKKNLKSWCPHIGINERKMLTNALKVLVKNPFKESFYGKKIIIIF